MCRSGYRRPFNKVYWSPGCEQLESQARQAVDHDEIKALSTISSQRDAAVTPGVSSSNS
jgi:hypothetical protein